MNVTTVSEADVFSLEEEDPDAVFAAAPEDEDPLPAESDPHAASVTVLNATTAAKEKAASFDLIGTPVIRRPTGRGSDWYSFH